VLHKEKTKIAVKRVGKSALHMTVRLLQTFIGSCIISISLNAMIIPYGLITGGAGGAAILGNMAFGLPVHLGILLFNIPLLIWGFIALPWRYMLQCLIGVAVITITLPLTEPYVPAPYLDIYIASIFSGVLSGIGGGLILRSGASAGGTDIISVILKRKWNISVGASALSFNLVIMIIGLFFYDIRFILYSIVSIYIASKTANAVIDGLNQNKSVMVISDHYELISAVILEKMGRGVTYLHGCGGFSGMEKNVLICVVSNFELATLKEIVHDADPQAFFFVSDTSEVSGKGFKRSALQQ